jgi:hypothetical protein
MSFLNSNSTMFISARLTNIGKKLISKGNFVIKYFQIGDSEYDYSNELIKTQKVFNSFDFEYGVKYPYKNIDNKNYGQVIEESQTKTVRQVVPSTGIVTEYKKFDENNGDGIFVNCYSETSNFTKLNGTNEIEVNNLNYFNKNDIITIIFNDFGGMDSKVSMVTKNLNNISFKIVEIVENKLILDRSLPYLANLKGSIRILLNSPHEKNTWKCSIVSNQNDFTSIKEYLGYTTNDSQVFVDDKNNILDYPTSFVDSFNDKILVSPNEQKQIAILYLSDIKNKNGSYISYDSKSIKSKLAYNNDGELITDTEYFEIFIPFIFYHKNTSEIPGAIFKMDRHNFYVKSLKNDDFKLMFRYLVDEKGNKIGKVFPHKQIVIFDDQEIVNLLNYKTNRKYSLPSPKVSTSITTNEFFDYKKEDVWITYNLKNEIFDGEPCGYVKKVTAEYNSNINIEFGKNTFTSLKTNLNEIKNGYIADKFEILIQVTEKNKTPNRFNWKSIDLTSQIENHKVGEYISEENLTSQKFIIDKNLYEKSKQIELNDLSINEEFVFPGNIKLVLASDIEEMRILINTPHNNFNESQNPTYQEGQQKKVTEIALLNEEKETLIMAKMAVPVTRDGSQTFVVKLDF